jgi:choline dehydrogenase-like flavoprotein
MKLTPVDAVVIGSGAGGGAAAYELATAGFQVVLLERGRLQRWTETLHDELRSQRTTVLGNAFGPDDQRYRRVIHTTSGQSLITLPSDGAYNNVAACAGGGTASYGAMAWRFLEKDFKMKSTYGHVPGSTLEDWPISYADLEPFYDRAERLVGVSGQAGANPFEAPRKNPYPMPPLPLNTEAAALLAAGRKIGLHPFPIPMAINSVRYDGRPACIACPHCVGFGCESNSKNGSQNTLIPRAIKTGHCSFITEAVAKEILTGPSGNASAVAYYKDGQLFEQPCRLVVVACSATETPRLLLNSKSKLHPNGLGNHNGWLGRNLQGHAYSGAAALFDRELLDGIGPAARVAACDFNHNNPGIAGGAMLANEFIRLPYLFAKSMRPPRIKRWGAELKQYFRQFYKRSAGVKGPVQEMPLWENRVEVDPSVRDHWGIPVAALTTRRHPKDVETGRFIASKAAAWLRAAGAIEVWEQIPGTGSTGGQHQAGTCRMGADSKTSVTDPSGRLHSVDNVFIADGSLLVTNGGFNPALTIFALGFRTGRLAAKSL